MKTSTLLRPAAAAVAALVLLARPAVAAPGDRDATFTPPVDLDGDVFGIAVQPDGKVIVGGFFADVDGIATLDRLVRLDPDGIRDATFTPPANLNSAVICAALRADGKVVVGGAFVNVEDIGTLDCLVGLDADGSRDASFTPPAFLNSSVRCVALQADGKIIIGGLFTNVEGITTLDRVVRLNSDGSRDTSFTPPADLDGDVNCAVMQADGKVIIAGNFTDVDGIGTLDRIVRLNPNGSRDTTFTPPADLNDDVRCAVLQADGKVIIGGDFTDVDGIATLDRLVRLNPDGSRDASFVPPANLSNWVYSAVLQADGKVIVAGNFTDVDGILTLDRLVRLNPDGSRDTSFAPPANLNFSVYCAIIQADGKVIIGGEFINVDGIATLDRLVRLENDAPTGSLTVPNLSRVQWTRGGTAPEATRTTFDYSTDGGATFTSLGSGTRISGGWQITGVSIPANSLVRARAFITGGVYNGSSGIGEATTTAPAAKAPTLQVRGKRTITTTRPRVILRGTASDPDGDLVAVRYRDTRPKGRRLRPARGLAKWSAVVVLKKGRNVVTVRAFDAIGLKSPIRRVTIRRTTKAKRR